MMDPSDSEVRTIAATLAAGLLTPLYAMPTEGGFSRKASEEWAVKTFVRIEGLLKEHYRQVQEREANDIKDV